jgi:hypothetical protein
VSASNPRIGAAADISAVAADEDVSPLHALLRQGAPAAALPAPGQVVLGTLQAIPAGNEPGAAEVAGLGRVAVAHSLVPLAASQIGQGVALSVLDGGAALVLGLLWQADSAATEPAKAMPSMAPASTALAVTIDGHREVIEAAQELELRCGEACIVLTADGRIQLRGTYITSHASVTQRIVGGSVLVN